MHIVLYLRTVESPNNEHFITASFVLCKEVVLFGKLKVYVNYKGNILGTPVASFVERLSLL